MFQLCFKRDVCFLLRLFLLGPCVVVECLTFLLELLVHFDTRRQLRIKSLLLNVGIATLPIQRLKQSCLESIKVRIRDLLFSTATGLDTLTWISF